MSDTIFYSMKLKANKTPKQAFAKILKAVKPKGVTKNWNVSTEGNALYIDFGDEVSEPFCLAFDKKEAGGSCKVSFPMEGKLFEDEKKSEWKTLIAILHSIKFLCSEINVEDDYDIAGEYFKSLDYAFDIRELTTDENARLDRLFQEVYNNHEAFLLKIFSEDTKRDFPKHWTDALGPCILLRAPFPKISAVWETYVYETSTLKNKSLREIYYNRNWYQINGEYHLGGDPPAEIYTFCLGIGRLFSSYDFVDNTFGRGNNVTKYYNDKFLPLIVQADAYGKCRMAYQFMLSLYDYCKFRFVGKDVINEMNTSFDKEHPSDLPK